MRWFWSLYGMFGVPAELRSDGQAATLDEAKAQFETAWRRRSAWAQLTASTPRLPACLAPPSAERLVIQRIGQNVFRDALMDYWGGRCPLTGISEPALLRASHIVPWFDCDDAQRLDRARPHDFTR
jgi:HNH endonuclease